MGPYRGRQDSMASVNGGESEGIASLIHRRHDKGEGEKKNTREEGSLEILQSLFLRAFVPRVKREKKRGGKRLASLVLA